MKLFVMGGNGFVGSGFVRVCRELGWDCTVLSRDTYDQHVGERCDILVNANGNSRKPLAVKAPLEDFDASVRSVRRSLVDFAFDRYIYLSSCDVYPDCSSPDLTREDRPIDVRSQSPYGFHKYLAEQCVRHAAPTWMIARLGGFVGPGLKKNAIYDILHGGPLWLDPASELQFLSTDAAARLILDLAGQGFANDVVNVCGKGVIRLAEVLDDRGEAVPVNPGSPTVRYDVNVEKLSGLVKVPETRSTVLTYVQGWRP